MEREILIAGAGLSGLTAAINLKKGGRAVRVLERNEASGEHRLPDWDCVENWTSLEDLPFFLQSIGIESARFRFAGSTSFSVIDPYRKRYDVHTERPLFYMVKRGPVDGGLDHGLQRHAEEMGIPIEYGVSCPPRKANIWAGGTFGQGSFMLSTGIIFKTDHADCVCVLVDAGIAPRAYAYLVVVDGEGTLAVVLTRARKEANRLLERAIQAFKSSTDLNILEPRKSGGTGGDMAAFWNGRSDVVIGEAGGFQDYLWGFGIRHALTSGYLAAQAILNEQDWQSLADEQLRPLVRASLVNRWLYDRVPNRGYALLIRRFATSPDLNALIGRWYHPRKLHRLMWPVASQHFKRRSTAPSEHDYSNRTQRVASS